jgi:hypothetical protein
MLAASGFEINGSGSIVPVREVAAKALARGCAVWCAIFGRKISTPAGGSTPSIRADQNQKRLCSGVATDQRLHRPPPWAVNPRTFMKLYLDGNFVRLCDTGRVSEGWELMMSLARRGAMAWQGTSHIARGREPFPPTGPSGSTPRLPANSSRTPASQGALTAACGACSGGER